MTTGPKRASHRCPVHHNACLSCAERIPSPRSCPPPRYPPPTHCQSTLEATADPADRQAKARQLYPACSIGLPVDHTSFTGACTPRHVRMDCGSSEVLGAPLARIRWGRLLTLTLACTLRAPLRIDLDATGSRLPEERQPTPHGNPSLPTHAGNGSPGGGTACRHPCVRRCDAQPAARRYKCCRRGGRG